MATDAEIAYVRRNTNELTDATYSDELLAELIDTNGVEATIATVWEEKSASAASAVDVTEAGASHKFSDIYKAYSAQAAYWRKKVDGDADPELSARVKVKKIVRS